MGQPQAPSFALVNLGCPKNQVDGEGMEQLLLRSGCVRAADPRRADTIVVNTCAFIRPAVEESIKTIRALATRKRPGQVIIVAGCLAQRYGERLTSELPGVDGILGTLRWNEIAELTAEVRKGQPTYWLGPARSAATPPRASRGPSAYVKISDGCDVDCAFCTIPSIKGRHRSKPPEQAIAEARELASQGVREVILIGQDTTAYGRDLGQQDGLAQLLDRLCAEVPELLWIRVMYAFPGRLTPRLLETIARQPQVVKYLDLPLQHASRGVLARMGRPRQDLAALIDQVRAAIPNVAIRSAFIVGYPGETEAEFEELLGFLQEVKLDRVGIFKYSREDGTPAAELPDQVPESVKERRYARAMRVQRRVSLMRNRALVGQVLPVLVDGRVVGETQEPVSFRSVGRSYRDAPEVDGLVFIRDDVVEGEIVRVRVTQAMDYDLVGEVVGT